MPAAVNSDLIEKIRQLGDQATAGTGIEIADVQLRGAGKGRLLRLYIDKVGGVTHGDCEIVSERVGKLLDEGDAMPDDAYTLEVSSLGSDRKFNTLRDYERVVGQKLALTLRNPVDGHPRLEGKLERAAEGALELQSAGRLFTVPLENIAKAKMKFEP